MIINPYFKFINKNEDLVKLDLKCLECNCDKLKLIEVEIGIKNDKRYRISYNSDIKSEDNSDNNNFLIITALCLDCHNISNFKIEGD